MTNAKAGAKQVKPAPSSRRRPMVGSFTNRILEATRSSAPVVVGQGATVILYTDRHAATVVEVSKDARRVVVQRDIAKRVDKNGISESQVYEFERDPSAPRETFTLRASGKYIAVGESMRTGTVLRIGERSAYHDYSF